MRFFLLKILVASFLLLAALNLIGWIKIHGGLDNYDTIGKEAYESIRLSKQKTKFKKLLIGDSIARQIATRNRLGNSVQSLACNQAVSMAGQYVLLNNYIQSGNQFDTLYILYSPFSFLNNLNQIFTFNYFMKPFYEDQNFKFFSTTVHDQISKIPLNSFSQLNIIKSSNWSPNYTSKAVAEVTFLSPISIEYLTRIDSLSKVHKFHVIVVSPPCSKNLRRRIERMDKDVICNNKLDLLFKGYFESIIYLDDSKFTDGFHFQDPIPTAVHLDTILRNH
jgi:hypothetical protein